MNIYFYRYGNICEPHIIDAFSKAGVDVNEQTAEITDKKLSQSARVKMVDEDIRTYNPLFVFSVNFFPAIAKVCSIYNIKYVCWTVDCPVLELFDSSISLPTNRIFCFDRMQYDFFHKYNEEGVFYLPLAGAIASFENAISSISDSDRNKYSHDISFVGSLYNEKSPLRKMYNNMPQDLKGYIDGVINASVLMPGVSLLNELPTKEIISYLYENASDFYMPESDEFIDENGSFTEKGSMLAKAVTSYRYLGYEASSRERINTLNKLGEYFNVDLYTRSDISDLKNIHTHGGVSTMNEMPKIFALSKINLNITIKPITSGLPLRIFDIMACGGFVMTNFQAAIPELFNIGEEIETYSSMTELINKCSYYLSHEDERRAIALNGYNKVKKNYLFEHRIVEILKYL